MGGRKKGSARRKARPVNLNLILWFSFLLFAVVLIALFTVVQHFQLTRQYREEMRENLWKAAYSIKAPLKEGDPDREEVGKILLTIVNEYGVSAYLFSADGESIYPAIPVSERPMYVSIYEKVKEKYEALPEDKRGENLFVPVPEDDAEGYATTVSLWNSEQYLYLTSSYEPVEHILNDMTWLSIITAFFAVALSFVVSGFVSMVITKPVTEVTERAKELARGNYVAFDRMYFCTEVNDLSRALDYAGTEISKTDRMQKEFIANVSHDFKTPLTMIKAYASMIREISGDDPEKRAAHTQVIIDETDRLAALVGDLLDLSRLQAGADSVERTVFNLSEEVWRVADRFGFLTDTEGYTFVTEVDEDVYTFAGKERVEQVLYNLIGNAVNYTGGDKKVTIRLKSGEKASRFEVIDTGKGIPPEEIDTIWERYYRSSDAHKRPVQGTGLGLSIVKNVLKKYNIPFGVSSEIGKGSCFWVEFPNPPET